MDDRQHWTRGRIGQKGEEKNAGWIQGYQAKHEHHQQNNEKGDAPAQVDAFATVVGKIRYHKEANDSRQNGHHNRQLMGQCITYQTVVMTNPNHTGNDAGSSGARQPGKVVFIGIIYLGIKTRQAKSRTGYIDKGRAPSKLTQITQRPTEHDQRRRNTKGDHI